MTGVTWFFVLKLIAALGCGIVAGVLFAFSTFVMPALARLQPRQGIAAMQAINITAINFLFMLAFMGTALVCLALVIASLFKWHSSGTVFILLGSLFYLIGVVGVTSAVNVPLNDALAVVNPDSTEGANLWARYLTDWTTWNHVRTTAALVASTLFILAVGDRTH